MPAQQSRKSSCSLDPVPTLLADLHLIVIQFAVSVDFVEAAARLFPRMQGG